MDAHAFDLHKLLLEQSKYRDKRAESDDEIVLKPSIERALDQALERARSLTQLAAAGKRLIRLIHAVPSLYDDVERGHLEFYIGRSGATARNIYSRFAHHADNKDHEAGLVVCRCATEDAPRWEGVAVRVARHLKAKHRLCVANIAAHGGGGMPRSKESVIYLTWRKLPRKVSLVVPKRSDVDNIAVAVSEEVDDVSEDTVRNAVAPITRPTDEVAEIDWATGHDQDDWRERYRDYLSG